MGTKEDKSERRQKQKIVEQAHKGRSTTNLYLANTREVGPRSRGFRGCGLVVGGKGGLYLIYSRDFFWEYTLLGWYLTQRSNRWLGPSDACHRVRYPNPYAFELKGRGI